MAGHVDTAIHLTLERFVAVNFARDAHGLGENRQGCRCLCSERGGRRDCSCLFGTCGDTFVREALIIVLWDAAAQAIGLSNFLRARER